VVSVRRALLRAASIATCALASHAAAGAAHPLHTSLAQLAYEPSRRELTVSVRVFADDFGAAVARAARLRPAAGLPVPEAAMYRYVTSRFALTDAAGRAVPLAWCGVRQAGEMLFLCLRAPAPRPPTGLRLRNALLVEAFDDQVNIVQTTFQASRRTTMFTAGDGAKPLQ
jgi:hypothetical protein